VPFYTRRGISSAEAWQSSEPFITGKGYPYTYQSQAAGHTQKYDSNTPIPHMDIIPIITGNLASPAALREFIITILKTLPGSK